MLLTCPSGRCWWFDLYARSVLWCIARQHLWQARCVCCLRAPARGTAGLNFCAHALACSLVFAFFSVLFVPPDDGVYEFPVQHRRRERLPVSRRQCCARGGAAVTESVGQDRAGKFGADSRTYDALASARWGLTMVWRSAEQDKKRATTTTALATTTATTPELHHRLLRLLLPLCLLLPLLLLPL